MKIVPCCLVFCLALANTAFAQDSVVISDRWTARNTGYFTEPCDGCFDQEFVRITIEVKQHIAGPMVPTRAVGVWAVHGGSRNRTFREERLFVLRPIADEETRVNLEAEYQILEMPLLREMYCIRSEPESVGLPRDIIVYSNDRGYCFEPPRINR